MSYEIAFEFDDGTVLRHLQVDRIVSDPRNEAARIDIPLNQFNVQPGEMMELARRVQSEDPHAVLLAGDEDGMFLAEQAARMGVSVLLRFTGADTERRAEEEVYISGDRLVF